MYRPTTPTRRLIAHLSAALILLLAASLILTPLGTRSARAQGGFSPEEQAALEATHAAIASVLALDSYTALITQQMDQVMIMEQGSETVRIVQHITSEGEMQYVRAPDQPFDNRRLDLTQFITQEIDAGNQSETSEVGPNRTQMIAVDGRIYLRLDMPPDMAMFIPQGWQDVTEGASMFPGMEMLDVNGILQSGQSLSLSYMDEFFEAVTRIEILEPVTENGQTYTSYRVSTDPAVLLDNAGIDAMLNMFNANAMPGIDIEVFIHALLDSPEAKILLEVTLDASGALVQYAERTLTNADISAAFTDPTMVGITVTLTQDTLQTYVLTDINEPITITAPELD